jgi:hypothetical protein
VLAITRIGLLIGIAARLAGQAPPISGSERLKWFAVSSAGPASLAGGVIGSAWGTMLNTPREYGPHWEGFGDRYGMRLTGVVTGNAMEAGLGALWGEDPRYVRATGQGFGGRVKQIVRMTFVAGNRPAYARYIATAGNNFLSNTWREKSEADTEHAVQRIAWGFLGRMASNAFAEFWPSVRKAIHHGSRQP